MYCYRPRETICCGSNKGCCRTKLDLHGIPMNHHRIEIKVVKGYANHAP